MRRGALLYFIVVGLLALPLEASANAGTPLMWASLIHLAIGNALIGLLEGCLLTWWFGVPRAKAVALMIPANYASAWLGGVFIRGAIVKALPMDLTNGWLWFWIMVVVTYSLTLLLEFPFIAWALRSSQGWLKRAVRASLMVQSSSYILLFGWYWMASGMSLYTKMHVCAPEDLTLPKSVQVYFIASSDGAVYRRYLGGKDVQKIYELHSKDRNDRLFVRPCPVDSNRWDLIARMETGDRRDARFVAVSTNLNVQAAPDPRYFQRDRPEYDGTWLSFGDVPQLGSAAVSQWEFWAGFWPIEGLLASRKQVGDQLRFSYETPFGAWAVRNAVHLPTDKVLFQLGEDQICGFDPVERRVALLWHGRGPVAVIDKESSNVPVEMRSKGP